MRDIKFRGLDKNGKWVYGDLIKTSPNSVDGGVTCWIKPNTHLGLGAISTPTDSFIKVTPDTVGQFTGLEDRNGTGIYEGDIVEDHVGIGVVKYSGKNGAFRVSSGDGQAKWFYDYILNGERESIEVIANIHQNPELL